MENYWNDHDNRNRPDRRDNWNSQNDRRREDDRNRYQNQPPQDPDTYRGAYRLDNSSDHRHVSTYYGFGNQSRPEERQQQHFSNERNANQSSQTHNALNQRRHDERMDFRNEPRNYEKRQHQEDYTSPVWRDYMDHADDWGRGNFYNDYGPDHYPHYRGENTGNMAGSLSFGYDGDRISNPDFDRRYNPLTGEIRQESGNRHRRNIGKNPSSYRLHDLNEDRQNEDNRRNY